MLTRREFIRTAALFALAPRILAEREKEIWVNDVHSQLNRTRVRQLVVPRTRDELAAWRSASQRRHLGFGLPPFDGANNLPRTHLHRCALNRVISFDRTWFDWAEAGINGRN
jgi:hypothetical protein